MRWIVLATIVLVVVAWIVWLIVGASSVALNGLLIFTGVLFSSAIGFCGLIINSNYQDRLRRDAILEQREFDKRGLAAALAGEADVSTVHIRAAASRLRKAVSELAPKQALGNFSWPEPSSVIYEANANRIGALGPELAGQLAQQYGKLTLWRNLNLTHRETLDADQATNVARSLIESDVIHWVILKGALLELARIELDDNEDEAETSD